MAYQDGSGSRKRYDATSLSGYINPVATWWFSILNLAGVHELVTL